VFRRCCAPTLVGAQKSRAPRGAELAPDGIDAAELNVVSAGGMPLSPAHHELQHRVLLAALLRRGTGPDIHLLKSRCLVGSPRIAARSKTHLGDNRRPPSDFASTASRNARIRITGANGPNAATEVAMPHND
jgi:hypothetical protein